MKTHSYKVMESKQSPTSGFGSEIKAITISKTNLFRFSKAFFDSFDLNNNSRLDILINDNNKLALRFHESGTIEVRNRNVKEYAFTCKRINIRIRKILKVDDSRLVVYKILEPIVIEDLSEIFPLEIYDTISLVKHKK